MKDALRQIVVGLVLATIIVGGYWAWAAVERYRIATTQLELLTQSLIKVVEQLQVQPPAK